MKATLVAATLAFLGSAPEVICEALSDQQNAIEEASETQSNLRRGLGSLGLPLFGKFDLNPSNGKVTYNSCLPTAQFATLGGSDAPDVLQGHCYSNAGCKPRGDKPACCVPDFCLCLNTELDLEFGCMDDVDDTREEDPPVEDTPGYGGPGLDPGFGGPDLNPGYDPDPTPENPGYDPDPTPEDPGYDPDPTPEDPGYDPDTKPEDPPESSNLAVAWWQCTTDDVCASEGYKTSASCVHDDDCVGQGNKCDVFCYGIDFYCYHPTASATNGEICEEKKCDTDSISCPAGWDCVDEFTWECGDRVCREDAVAEDREACTSEECRSDGDCDAGHTCVSRWEFCGFA